MAVMSVGNMLMRLKQKRAIEEEENEKRMKNCYWHDHICHCYNNSGVIRFFLLNRLHMTRIKIDGHT